MTDVPIPHTAPAAGDLSRPPVPVTVAAVVAAVLAIVGGVASLVGLAFAVDQFPDRVVNPLRLVLRTGVPSLLLLALACAAVVVLAVLTVRGAPVARMGLLALLGFAAVETMANAVGHLAVVVYGIGDPYDENWREQLLLMWLYLGAALLLLAPMLLLGRRVSARWFRDRQWANGSTVGSAVVPWAAAPAADSAIMSSPGSSAGSPAPTANSAVPSAAGSPTSSAAPTADPAVMSSPGSSASAAVASAADSVPVPVALRLARFGLVALAALLAVTEFWSIQALLSGEVLAGGDLKQALIQHIAVTAIPVLFAIAAVVELGAASALGQFATFAVVGYSCYHGFTRLGSGSVGLWSQGGVDVGWWLTTLVTTGLGVVLLALLLLPDTVRYLDIHRFRTDPTVLFAAIDAEALDDEDELADDLDSPSAATAR